jgi:ABC-type lipoprotein release transport system permease subunit
MHFQLAWRNIWRNPRRTTIILIAIVIGMWTMIVGSGLMRGMIDQMVENSIATLTGHIQIHAQGYRQDPTVENSMPKKELLSVLDRYTPPGSRWAARVRLNAIAGNARHSRGVTLVGIQPDREAAVSFIGDAPIEGRYLKEDDSYGILVGKSFAEDFETKLGNKLVLMAQDTNQEIASRAFRIVGIYQAELHATEKQFVFIPLEAAQDMLLLGNKLSEISIVLQDKKSVPRAAERLRQALPESYEVHTWRELLPVMTAYLNLMDGWILIWYVVVFIAMGFGIVNTVLMAVFERIREFGLLKALGMKPWWIIRGVLIESFFLLLIGTALGNSLGFLTNWIFLQTGIDLSFFAAGAQHFGMSRIIYPSVNVPDIVLANMVVFVLGMLVSLYPASRAARFTPVEALAHT